MVKLQESKNRFFVTLPSEIVKLKQWTKGKELMWVASEDGSIRLKELK